MSEFHLCADCDVVFDEVLGFHAPTGPNAEAEAGKPAYEYEIPAARRIVIRNRAFLDTEVGLHWWHWTMVPRIALGGEVLLPDGERVL